MKHVRRSRKALKPIWDTLKPKPWTWTGNRALARIRPKRFRELVIEIDDAPFRSFCTIIGFVEVNWALLESHLDRWIQIAFVKLQFRGGEKEVPRAFAKKVRYLRKAFKDVRLSEFRNVALDVVERANKLSETRHDLTHGVITSIEPKNTFFYELENRKLGIDGFHTSRGVRFDVREFPSIGKELTSLGKIAAEISQGLACKFL